MLKYKFGAGTEMQIRRNYSWKVQLFVPSDARYISNFITGVFLLQFKLKQNVIRKQKFGKQGKVENKQAKGKIFSFVLNIHHH